MDAVSSSQGLHGSERPGALLVGVCRCLHDGAAARVHQLLLGAAVVETMPAPSETEDVATSFGTVRAYTWAGGGEQDSPPVVPLPGRTSGAPMWAANVPKLARSRRVIALDALGDAGMSVQPAPLTSVEDQAAWTDEVISALAPEGPHLVGHSFGGATAAVYAGSIPTACAP